VERQAVSVFCICVSRSTSFGRSPQWFHQVAYCHLLQMSNFQLAVHAIMTSSWLQRSCSTRASSLFLSLDCVLTELGYL
jgi:hypothetical protein